MRTTTQHHVVPSPQGRGDAAGRGKVTLGNRLRHDLLSARFPRAVLAAWILTTVIVLYCFAIAGVIFSGPLHPFAAEGAGMLLFGAAVFCLLVGLSSGYQGAIAVPQDIPAAVLGTMATTVAAGTAHAPIASAFMTMTALLIVFVDVMKEMPATLLLRPFGWDTLAVRIYEMTSEGEWERAALPALTLILVGLAPVIQAVRQSASGR